jgi:hypothetical protein
MSQRGLMLATMSVAAVLGALVVSLPSGRQVLAQNGPAPRSEPEQGVRDDKAKKPRERQNPDRSTEPPQDLDPGEHPSENQKTNPEAPGQQGPVDKVHTPPAVPTHAYRAVMVGNEIRLERVEVVVPWKGPGMPPSMEPTRKFEQAVDDDRNALNLTPFDATNARHLAALRAELMMITSQRVELMNEADLRGAIETMKQDLVDRRGARKLMEMEDELRMLIQQHPNSPSSRVAKAMMQAKQQAQMVHGIGLTGDHPSGSTPNYTPDTRPTPDNQANQQGAPTYDQAVPPRRRQTIDEPPQRQDLDQ